MAGEDDEDVIVSLPPVEGEVKITKASDTIESASFNEDPVADLKNQFATMTARATAAESLAHQNAQELQQAHQRLQSVESEVVTSQLETVESGIAAAEAEAANAEAAISAALEAGDGPALARAQRAMSIAVSRGERLKEAKDDLADAAKRKPTQDAQTRQQPPQRRAPADPVEAMIAANGISAKSAAWIRAHPEVVTDKKMNARMMAAHNLALADDIAVESEEYFQRIEEGIKPAVTKTAAKPAAQQQQNDGRRPSSAAASASGASGGLNGGGTEVRLTRGEANSATDGTIIWNYDSPDGKFKKGDPIGLAEFARRKQEGMKAGLYDRGGQA